MDIAVYFIIGILAIFSQTIGTKIRSKRMLKKAKKKLILPDTWEVLEVTGNDDQVMIVRRLERIRKLKPYYTNRLYLNMAHNRKDKKQQGLISQLEDDLYKRFTETKEGVLALIINDPLVKDFVVYYNENVDINSFLEELLETYDNLKIHIEIAYDPFWQSHNYFNKISKNAKK